MLKPWFKKIFQLFFLPFVLYCLITAEIVLSQDFKINRIEETEQTVVYTITQDLDGFIWYGGELGLTKHNGYQLKSYQHNPYYNSLSNNDVGCLLVDDGGMIWAATWGGGVNRFNPYTGEFTVLKNDPDISNTLSDNRVQNIFRDHEGMLWFGTYAGGLNRYNPGNGEFTRFYHQPSNSNSLSHNRVWCVTEDSSGRLWIATDGGLDLLDKHRRYFSHFYHNPKDYNSISSNQIQWVYRDHQHNMWVSTKNGLNRFNPETKGFTRFMHNAGNSRSISSNIVYTVLEDRNGYIWAGTNDGGLNRLDQRTGEFLRFVHEPKNTNSISNNDIRSIFEDRSGVLWIGTRGGGINTIDLKPKKFYHIFKESQNQKGINHNTITAFSMDAKNNLWIGTDGGGINVINLKTNAITYYTHNSAKKNSVSHNRIRALYRDFKGTMWVGTYGGGLNKFISESDGFVRYTHLDHDKKSLSNDRVYVISEDNQGTIWIGTDEGLNRLNNESNDFNVILNNPADSNSLSHNSVLSIKCEPSSGMWIGTWGGGLNYYDPRTGRFDRYIHIPGNPGSISNGEIFCIFEDRNGRLWIGTRGGLNKMDKNNHTFRSYTAEHGLPINEIWGILEDSFGNLWISTTNGLSKFHPASETFRNYDMDDGLQGRQFRQGAYYMDRAGNMYFGGVNGFNWFYPDSIHDNTYIPPVVINAFRIFDQQIMIRKNTDTADPVELDYDQNFFSFEFAALDYSNPRKNQYAYKLQGFDTRWIFSGSRNFASYTNLDAGEYIFMVKGSNNDGIWNEEGTSVNIRITPPFWLRWWFRLAVAAAIVSLVYILYQLRVRSIKLNQRILEEQVAERTVELTNSRNELESKKNQLEQINLIVQTINSEIRMDRLLSSLIRETELISGTIQASAYVFQPETDNYNFAASTGSSEIPDMGFSFTEDDINERFLERAAEMFPNIFALKQGASEKSGVYQAVIFRINVQHRTEGYLIFMAADQDGIKFYELSLLNDLRDHIISAFLKAKMIFEQQRYNEELIRLNNMKNEFLGIAAHDLRNPLTAIIGYIDLILEDINAGAVNAELIAKDLNTVIKSARQMVQLITDLLDISAIESGKMNLDLQRHNINAVFDECEKIHRKNAQRKFIELDIEKNTNIPDALFDKSRITEVLDNLISNAIKYTQPGGRVRLFSRYTDHKVEAHVQDTGLGLTEDDIKDIFTGMRRLSNKPTGGETSTGLGLVIVKKIIDLHGGDVRVTSRKGEGSTFIVSLPVAGNNNAD